MQHGFGGGLGLVRLDPVSVWTDVNEITPRQLPLIDATGGDQELRRIVIQHRAVVATGPNRPASLMKQSPAVSQLVERFLMTM